MKTKSPLTQLFNITEDTISFAEFTFSETLPEVVETSVVHLEEFLQNPTNIKVLIDDIKETISIFMPIIKCVNKISAPIKKFFSHTEKLLGYLKSDYSYLGILKKFEDEISHLNKAILSLFYGYVLNPVEETTNLFSEAVAQIESIFDNFTNYVQEKWFRYLTVLEEGINILLSFYNGYFASDFSQTLITLFSTNKFSKHYSLDEHSSTNVQASLTLDENN